MLSVTCDSLSRPFATNNDGTVGAPSGVTARWGVRLAASMAGNGDLRSGLIVPAQFHVKRQDRSVEIGALPALDHSAGPTDKAVVVNVVGALSRRNVGCRFRHVTTPKNRGGKSRPCMFTRWC